MSVITDRFRGRFSPMETSVDFSIMSLTTTAYSIGDVLNVNSLPIPLACLGISAGQSIRLVKTDIWEYAATGTARAPSLGFYLFDRSYVLPPQNNPFVADLDPTALLHYYEILTGAYKLYDAGFTPKYAHATAVEPNNNTALKLKANSRNLHLVIVTLATPTFASGAYLSGRLHFAP